LNLLSIALRKVEFYIIMNFHVIMINPLNGFELLQALEKLKYWIKEELNPEVQVFGISV